MNNWEQKYKDLIARLQKAKDDDNVCDERFCCVIDEIATELVESEDEKVRKEIISFIQDHINEINLQVSGDYDTRDKEDIALQEWCKKALAWLEKQGELKSIWHNEDEEPKRDSLILLVMQSGTPIVAKIIEPNHTFNHGERWAYIDDLLEKQGEQKVSYTTLVETGNGGINALITRELSTNGCDDEQKLADKVEQKFKVGNWYQCTKDFFGKGVTFDKNTAYYCAKEGCLQNEYGCHIAIVKDLYDNFKLWAIEDAKDGDLIYVSTEEKGIQAIFHEYKNDTIFFHCYLCADFVQGGYMPIGSVELAYPLQKTHYNRFFEKMHEAGYTFDFEKKELKKIDNEEFNGEDYGIDSLYHAQRILEKTLGSVDGYQTDDGILAHKCAITSVKKLYEQKSNWSEEDEKLTNRIEGWLETLCDYLKDSSPECIEDVKDIVEQLKSLKDRVQPIHKFSDTEKQEMFIKSQRPHFWRPTKGQLECLDVAIDKVDKDHSPFFTNRAYLTLKALKKQLEQL